MSMVPTEPIMRTHKCPKKGGISFIFLRPGESRACEHCGKRFRARRKDTDPIDLSLIKGKANGKA